MNILKQPIRQVLNDKVAIEQFAGWLLFGSGIVIVLAGIAEGPLAIRTVFHALGEGTVSLLLGAWILNAAESARRIASLEKENTALRAASPARGL